MDDSKSGVKEREKKEMERKKKKEKERRRKKEKERVPRIIFQYFSTFCFSSFFGTSENSRKIFLSASIPTGQERAEI